MIFRDDNDDVDEGAGGPSRFSALAPSRARAGREGEYLNSCGFTAAGRETVKRKRARLSMCGVSRVPVSNDRIGFLSLSLSLCHMRAQCLSPSPPFPPLASLSS
jgi:hypothetical protein